MTGAVDDLIRKFGLAPHPEGGYYKEIYRSDTRVHSDRAGDTRAAVTQIYFLLAQGQVSRFHRVAHDEIWHHYQGDPLTLIQFDGTAVTREAIGPGQDQFTAVVQAGTWQAAETAGAFSFVGCSVAPGFDFRDFAFLDASPKDLAACRALGPEYEHFL